MNAYYLNQNVRFQDPIYKNFKLWSNDVLEKLPNKNIFVNWYSLQIPLSSQFKKYFSNENTKSFLKTLPENSYLISVIYNDQKNIDTLPCFSETVRKHERIEDASKRLVKEELFSDTPINFLTKFEFKKQKIYTYYQDIHNFTIKNLYENETTEIKDRSRKINLLLFTDDLDKAQEFICKWRSRRHNLSGESERLYMTDLCLFKVNDILKL